MKRIFFMLATVVLTILTSAIKAGHTKTSYNKAPQGAQNAVIAKTEQVSAKPIKTAAKPLKVAEKPEPKPPSPAPHTLTCREAIAKVWPANLQSGAITVLKHENGLELVNRIGSLNYDGSRDYGCFQINNKAHPAFFATQDWRNAEANATEAYKIYLGRQSAQGNGWRAWYAVEGVLW